MYFSGWTLAQPESDLNWKGIFQRYCLEEGKKDIDQTDVKVKCEQTTVLFFAYTIPHSAH